MVWPKKQVLTPISVINLKLHITNCLS